MTVPELYPAVAPLDGTLVFVRPPSTGIKNIAFIVSFLGGSESVSPAGVSDNELGAVSWEGEEGGLEETLFLLIAVGISTSNI